MFHYLGKAVARTWPFLLVAWVALLVGTHWIAPPWEKVVPDKEFGFLPDTAPSRVAEEIFNKAFPEKTFSSNIVLLVEREDNEQGLTKQDREFISGPLSLGILDIAESEGGLLVIPPPDEDEDPFKKQAAPQSASKSIIRDFQTLDTPGVGALLQSPDGKAGLVVIQLTTDLLQRANWRVMDKIQGLLSRLNEGSQIPAGLKITMTGSAAIGRDHTLAQLQSAKATELLTVVLVVVLLVLIYRAPFLAFIPLVTVFLSVKLTRNILAILAGAGYLNLFEGIEIYVTILSYGAGVDYCLFLTARYQEEWERGANPSTAVALSIEKVGAALVASAATVMCGIGMMVFAQFGKFREAGVAIPIGLFIVLCAALTFSSALLRLAGRWAFWPHMMGDKSGGIAPAWSGWFDRILPHGGFQKGWHRLVDILRRRPGAVWLASVAVMAPFTIGAIIFHDMVSYDIIGNLPADATSVAGTRALGTHFPAGIMGPVTVLIVNPEVDFSTDEGKALVADYSSRLLKRREELGLADIRTLTVPLGITAAAQRALKEMNQPPEDLEKKKESMAQEYYVTDLGERKKIGTRLDLVLDVDPFTTQGLDVFVKLEQALRAELPSQMQGGSTFYFTGPTASIQDMRTLMAQDQVRIQILVLSGVFLILLVLLRRLVVSIYLILSVLFSYYATLGVSLAVFWLLDPSGFSGIDFKVVIFLFTILIAVGEDYNIFLMTRIHEEQQGNDPLRGISVGLERTGPIISSCGIIMAGTFASLSAGSLTEMKQLGFALAFGVLLDTFLVRPILVPAFLVMLRQGRFRWWNRPIPAAVAAPIEQDRAHPATP